MYPDQLEGIDKKMQDVKILYLFVFNSQILCNGYNQVSQMPPQKVIMFSATSAGKGGGHYRNRV